MDVNTTGSGQTGRTGRARQMWRIAGLGAGVAVGIAAVIAIGQVSVRGQTIRSQPFYELAQQLVGGSGIGVTIRDVDSADVTREKLPASLGAVVDDVRADSPAARAGIRAGDVIVAFDGEKIRSARHFARLVDETPEGREVETTVIRNGERINVKVTPDVTDGFTAFNRLRGAKNLLTPNRLELVRPSAETYSFSSDFPANFANRSFFTYGFSDRTRLGVSGQNLTGQLGDYFGTPEGVLVTSVDDGTPARTAGLKAGDVITRINGETVRNLTDLQRLVRSATGETSVTIFRDRKEETITLKIEDERVLTTRRRIVR